MLYVSRFPKLDIANTEAGIRLYAHFKSNKWYHKLWRWVRRRAQIRFSYDNHLFRGQLRTFYTKKEIEKKPFFSFLKKK